MKVSDAMTHVHLHVGVGHTLKQVANMMIDRKVGSAVVFDESLPGPGIITERNILFAAAGDTPLHECLVGDFMSHNLQWVSPDTSLEEAAATMVKSRIRHLAVIDGGDVVGILSMRDIVRAWTLDGADCDMPETEAEPVYPLVSNATAIMGTSIEL